MKSGVASVNIVSQGILIELTSKAFWSHHIYIEQKKTHPWDWPDFRAKLLLNSVEGKPVIVGDQVDGNTEVAEPKIDLDPYLEK